MNTKKNIVGKQLGGCTIISEYPYVYSSRGRLRRRVKCKCICGHIFDINYASLTKRKENRCHCEKLKDIPIGTRFGKLVIVEKVPRTKHSPNKYRCICDCGNQNHITNYQALKRNPKSCGCSKNIKHSLSEHPIYNSWIKLISYYKMNRIEFDEYHKYVISLGYKDGHKVFIKNTGSREIIGNIEVSNNSTKFNHLGSISKDRFSSNFKGVCFNKRKSKFMASIASTSFEKNNKIHKVHHTGYFIDEIDALRARNKLILEKRLSIYALQSPYIYKLFDNGKKISYSLPIEQYGLIEQDIKNKVTNSEIIKKYNL